jgi:hypothetical protein
MTKLRALRRAPRLRLSITRRGAAVAQQTTNAERFASIARKKADREVAMIEAAALVLQNASAAFKEAEKEAPDAAARASDTLTVIQKDALRSVGISVQRFWIHAVCCYLPFVI